MKTEKYIANEEIRLVEDRASLLSSIKVYQFNSYITVAISPRSLLISRISDTLDREALLTNIAKIILLSLIVS